MSTRDSFRLRYRLVNGSILGSFSYLELSTADEKEYSLTMTPLNRLAVGIIGIPHLGFRMRARIILSEARKANKTEKILDAGCGYGLYAMSLGELGYDVDAIDIDSRRIKVLTKMFAEYPILKDAINLHTGSLTSLPFPSNSYERIICSEVIEHMEKDNKAISELSRVLKPGGRLILSVPHDSKFNRKTFKRFGHERSGYTKEMLQTIMKGHNLIIEKVFYYERTIGTMLFNVFNSLHSKSLMGIFFYPFYLLYLLDYYIGFGEPNQIVVTAWKI